jgi:ribonuclease T
MSNNIKKIALNKRFRGFLPIIVDLETGGFNANKDALLEIAFIFINYDPHTNKLGIIDTIHFHVEPFPGANLDPDALEFTGIDPSHPFRFAVPEQEVLTKAFAKADEYIKQFNCSRAILVGHNPNFDLSFLLAAVKRCKLFKENPFHKFSTLDTATLGALLFKQTVLARAVRAAKIDFDETQAHSALYDATKTAEFFCSCVNLCDEKIL